MIINLNEIFYRIFCLDEFNNLKAQPCFSSFDFDIKLYFSLMKLFPNTVKVNPYKIGVFMLLNESFIH